MLQLLIILLILYLMYQIFRSIRIIKSGEVEIVERFGKYQTTFHAGLQFLNPFIDKVVFKYSLEPQVYEVPTMTYITKDHFETSVSGIGKFKILDPEKVSYQVENYKLALIQLIQTNLRSIIIELDSKTLLDTKEIINSKLIENIIPLVKPWGIEMLQFKTLDFTIER